MYTSKSSGLLKDNSWIKKPDDEDEDIDRDPNFGRSILGNRADDRYSGSPNGSSTTTTVSRDGKTTTTTETTITRSAVNKTSTTKTFTERVLSSSKSPQYSSYSPTKTTEVTRKSISSTSDAEDHLYESLVPSSTPTDHSPTDSQKMITTETVTVKSDGDIKAENDLYDRLIPKAIKDEAASGRTSSTSTESVTVRSTSYGGDDDLYESIRRKSSSLSRGESPTLTSSTSIRSYTSYTEDSPIISNSSYSISSKPGDEYSSDSTYSYRRPTPSFEYSSTSGPTSYTSTTYRSSSRSDDSLLDPIYSKSSIKNAYSSSERIVLEKDLCTSCRKPFTGDAKMILEDINVNCHASCFKCDVCSSTLGNLKAGDSMWVYRGMVHCENCFEVTKAKWHR